MLPPRWIFGLPVHAPQYLHPAGDIDIGRIFFALQGNKVGGVPRGDIDPRWNNISTRKDTPDDGLVESCQSSWFTHPEVLLIHSGGQETINFSVSAAKTTIIIRKI